MCEEPYPYTLNEIVEQLGEWYNDRDILDNLYYFVGKIESSRKWKNFIKGKDTVPLNDALPVITLLLQREVNRFTKTDLSTTINT